MDLGKLVHSTYPTKYAYVELEKWTSVSPWFVAVAAVVEEEEEEDGGVEGGTGAAELEGDEDRDCRVPPLSEWWDVFRTLQTAEVWRAHGTWAGAYTRPSFGSTKVHSVGYVGCMISPQSMRQGDTWRCDRNGLG